eukprot:3924448-Alexandrium_andersonii.AAC.1
MHLYQFVPMSHAARPAQQSTGWQTIQFNGSEIATATSSAIPLNALHVSSSRERRLGQPVVMPASRADL